jgi:hypothetical protein
MASRNERKRRVDRTNLACKPQKIIAYQSGNDSCVSLADWIGLRRFVDVVSLECLRRIG